MGSVSSVDEDIIVAPGRQYQRQCQPGCCRLADDSELSGARGWIQMRRKRKSAKNNLRMMILSE